MNQDNIQQVQLSNGVRIITEKVPGVRSVALGIWVGTGSRMEQPGEEGISHFIEHLLFKGTENRTARDIAESLDSVGGQLNAFTAKEMTCFYARVMEEHVPLAVEVLSDMFFNSTFKKAALDKERGVVKEEISMYEDSPDELIHDVFLATAWPNNPLGKAILGTRESLDGIDRQAIVDYMQRQYVSEKIVIAAAGAIDHEKIQKLVTPIFEKIAKSSAPTLEAAPSGLSGSSEHLTKATGQMQICLGTQGIKTDDKRSYPLYLLNNILGGGLSSRLVQSIREERGLAYSTYSFNSAFKDTGIYTFYAGTAPANAEQVIELFKQEMDNLCKSGVTELEFARAREQVKGALYMGLESVSSRMNRLGRNLLFLDRVISPEETIREIEKVKIQDLTELANYLFKDQPHVLATIGPEK